MQTATWAVCRVLLIPLRITLRVALENGDSRRGIAMTRNLGPTLDLAFGDQPIACPAPKN